MANTPEGKLTKKVKTFLDKQPIFYWKVSDKYTSGIPDIVGCKGGKFFAIELKAPGEKPRKLQTMIIRRIKNSGGDVLATDNYDAVTEFIEAL